MIPSLALREKAMQLLAADTATLAPAANEIKIALVKSAFVPSEQLVLADVDLADFDGSTPLEVKLNAQPEGLDPLTNDSVIDLIPDLGLWRWETTGLTNLPQTIHGYVLLNAAEDTVFASALLPQQITLDAINQRVDLDEVSLTQAAGSIS